MRLRFLVWLFSLPVIVFGAAELFFAILVHTPSVFPILPAKLKSIVSDIYWHTEVNVIQFSEACSQYDQELSYTLRRGRCQFSNPEFQTDVIVNSAGLRDDQASLRAPEVIVLGDSQAMGWGVEQSETISEQLERLSGKKVLNAGQSSYGTVRELLLLRRLDLSQLEYIVLLYSFNDYFENARFLEQGEYRQLITSNEMYEQIADNYSEVQRYRLLKYLAYLFRRVREGTLKESPKVEDHSPQNEFDALYAVLSEFTPPAAAHATLILGEVMDPMHERARAGRFVAAVEGFAELPYNRVVPINFDSTHTSENYFQMDRHLNKRGHRALAKIVAHHLQ